MSILMASPETLRLRAMRMFSGMAACAALIACSGSVFGQAREQHQVLFDEGRALRKKDDCPAAIEKFKASHALKPSVGALVNIAECEAGVGRLLAAKQHLGEALELARSTNNRWQTQLEKDLAALEEKIPTIAWTAPAGAPVGLTVLVDGRPAERGNPIQVDPGERRVLTKATGREDSVAVVSVKPGERREVEVKWGEPKNVGPTVSALPAPKQGKPDRTAAYLVGGIGVAGLAVATVTGFMILNAQSTVRSNCDSGTHQCTSSDGVDAASRGKKLLPINTVSWIVAGVGLGVGTTLYLVASPSKGAEAASVGIAGRF